jgi:light-regulated signal transduction histidine kinase (bacteriophytochrome)/CheY-like chemotaxis protein
MQKRLRAGRLRGAAPWEYTLQNPGMALDIAVHAQAGLVLVEAKFHRPVADPLLAGRQLQESLGGLSEARNDLTKLSRRTAAGIREMTGYERVLIYRFDPDWHGQAIAEDKNEDWAQSLDGLHFPASDIPAQARALYRISPFRWVPDRDFTPVSLSIDPNWRAEAQQKIDLSFARLRSQSPVHLQYHRNMGVNGAMSISILHAEKLWGLVVCHHRGPHHPDAGARAAAAALANAFALRVGEAEHADTEDARRADLQRLALLLTSMAEADRFDTSLTTGATTIADLFACTGAAVVSGSDIICLGTTPPAGSIRELAGWLSETHAGARLFQTENMSGAYPAWLPHAGIASGVLAVFLGGTDMLLWFRPEEPHQVSWGGNPYRPDEAGAAILPRQSFARWVDTKHGFARPWLAWELEIAESLRHGITDVILRSLRRITELNERLRQAQKMEAVGQLTGGIAHDFNNLLAGVTGSLELMRTRIGQGRIGDVESYVGAAMSAAGRATALVHRLLSFSRRQTLDPRPVNIENLLSAAAELIRRTVGPGIAVETLIGSDAWMTMCDSNQLDNALLNLAINARDAMPHGGRLTIATENIVAGDAADGRDYEVAPGQYLVIAVTDSGAGMSADIVARVFEPFFTTKPLGEGTGLGLSMVYGFVKQSHGHIGILSMPGQGTTVRLYMPRHHADGAAEVAALVLAPASSGPGSGTVLVVDDEAILRMILTESLEDLGYDVRVAADGAAALAILQGAEKIDLLITDVGLPGGMNGRQLADAASVFLPALKILFITGYAETGMLSPSALGPRMAVLTKPFGLDALAARVKAML